MRSTRTISSPVESARSAGLRYVTDDRPGIRRKMSSLGFHYYRPDGRLIRSPAELKRIARLAVPPAWTDVWICLDPRGHLQATGRDARGRKQYRYHPGWRETRDETKYERLPAFAAALPKIRARTTADLARSGLPREKVLAAVVTLLEKSLMRVGNEEYVKANRSFGLTTLRDNHVTISGSIVTFEFRGKSGIRHSVRVSDRRLARIVKGCRDLPGQELFQYLDDEGRRCNVGSGDVNDYLREICGEDFTAKDFRTWAGTVLMCAAFRELEATDTPFSKRLLQAIDAVAGMLGNTRAVCRKSYIHPGIIDACTTGGIQQMLAGPARRRRGLSADECSVLSVLERVAKQSKKKAA
jgi:DNA topoisomerase I